MQNFFEPDQTQIAINKSLEDTTKSAAAKSAEIILLTLQDNNGFKAAQSAIKDAKSNYTSSFLEEGAKGVLKFAFSFGAWPLYKQKKVENRMANVGEMTDKNYLETMYKLLKNQEGDINQQSFKGGLLKELMQWRLTLPQCTALVNELNRGNGYKELLNTVCESLEKKLGIKKAMPNEPTEQQQDCMQKTQADLYTL